MKKFIIFIFLLATFSSCQDEVKFNNPAFEGRKNNVFWRASNSKATIDANGSLTIQGAFSSEQLVLQTNSAAANVYLLGNDDLNKAVFSMKKGKETVFYATGSGFGNGEIVIEKYDAINKNITGTFKFNAENTDGIQVAGELLNFQDGRFYQVPVTIEGVK